MTNHDENECVCGKYLALQEAIKDYKDKLARQEAAIKGLRTRAEVSEREVCELRKKLHDTEFRLYRYEHVIDWMLDRSD